MIYKNKIQRATSVDQKNAYIDSLMYLYDMRCQNFADYSNKGRDMGAGYTTQIMAREYSQFRAADRAGIRKYYQKAMTTNNYEVPSDFTDRTVEDLVAEFREANGLNEHNFSICYYNTVTGEEYAWNDTWFSIAASTYKLPLNMVFYEMQQAGEITGDTKITWTGQTLDYIHEQSIVNSNNELSEALMYYWGNHVTYKEKLRKYFTMTDEEIDPLYYQGNFYCVRMMMDTLLCSAVCLYRLLSTT